LYAWWRLTELVERQGGLRGVGVGSEEGVGALSTEHGTGCRVRVSERVRGAAESKNI